MGAPVDILMDEDAQPLRRTLAAFVELTKPRILAMVLVTTTLGFALGGNGFEPFGVLAWTLLGTGLAAGGAGALNHVFEKDIDSRMRRTRNRPLPAGLLPTWAAVVFGGVLLAGSVVVLVAGANMLAAGLALISAFLYAFVYTPLKRVSWVNTPVGAIPGAIPPLIGWAAATGYLHPGAWVLFFILFLWQHPHFYAIAWMFRDDYRLGGLKMLPVVQPDGINTFRQSLAAAVLLIPVSLWPTFVRMNGWIYFAGAFLLGVWFLAACVRWRITETNADAQKVLRVSVMYFPLLLMLIALDSVLYNG